MKRWLAVLAFAAALTGCRVPSPHPPTPPVQTEFRLQVYVKDVDGKDLVNARVYRDNVDAENPLKGGSPVTLGPDAGAAWTLSGQDFNICALQNGYAAEDGSPTRCEPVPLHQDLNITVKLKALPTPPPPPPAPDVPRHWTKEQLQDFQGDLMVYAPEVGCQSDFTHIVCGARGLQNGWIWTLTLPRYAPESREIIYQKILGRGYTHVAVSVNACEIGSGYHDLLPVTNCDGYGVRMNAVLRELHQHNLIPICAGLGPNDPVQPDLDRSLCPVVMDDWDNDHKKDCRIKHLAETFPNALIYIEMPDGPNPSGQYAPGPDECSASPFPSGGGEWIRGLQKKYPNFTGVLYELSVPNGQAANVAQFNQWNVWFRDVQQVGVFETDTYWKFWDNRNEGEQIVSNDALRTALPSSHGYMSGGTSHPVPQAGPVSEGRFDGELQPGQFAVEHDMDYSGWRVSSEITKVEFALSELRLTFASQDTWPETLVFGTDGYIQYSLGVCMKPAGEWVCSAPIELWKGLPGSGGQVQSQRVDGVPPGQLPRNWFYDGRWPRLNGYQPKPGEVIGVYAVQGDMRNSKNSVQERTNIVLVKLPQENTAATYVK